MVKNLLCKFLLPLTILAFPISSAIAEKIQIDEGYYEKNLLGNCMFVFSKTNNQRVKIAFNSKTEGKYILENYREAPLELSTSDGNLVIKSKRGITTVEFNLENGQSFSKDVTKKDDTPSYLGDCKTKWDKYETLPSFPPSSTTSATSGSSSSPAPVKVDKNEIAELEKKLAALKQKSARTEEYKKMRSLLDQKLKEVQDQIRMLDQEYKDVLN